MNRRERRKLERQGKIPKAEPVYLMKPSDIKDAALKGAGEQAMLNEIHQQCLAADKSFTLDMDTIYLWTLHSKYGWGLKRLKQFYKEVFVEHRRMREFYEMDSTYPERYQLKSKGIDIEAWYNELFDEEGNFKKPEEINI
jgi:hypothetical protein